MFSDSELWPKTAKSSCITETGTNSCVSCIYILNNSRALLCRKVWNCIGKKLCRVALNLLTIYQLPSFCNSRQHFMSCVNLVALQLTLSWKFWRHIQLCFCFFPYFFISCIVYENFKSYCLSLFIPHILRFMSRIVSSWWAIVGSM